MFESHISVRVFTWSCFSWEIRRSVGKLTTVLKLNLLPYFLAKFSTCSMVLADIKVRRLFRKRHKYLHHRKVNLYFTCFCNVSIVTLNRQMFVGKFILYYMYFVEYLWVKKDNLLWKTYRFRTIGKKHQENCIKILSCFIQSIKILFCFVIPFLNTQWFGQKKLQN